MTSPVQGPGNISPLPGSDREAAPKPPGQAFGRSVSQTSGAPVFQQNDTETTSASEILKRELGERKITGLTAENLRAIAGDPKESMFKSRASPQYRQLLDVLNEYQAALKNGVSVEKKTATLNKIIELGEAFAEKKAIKSNKSSNPKEVENILTRMKGAETVVKEAKATKLILQLQTTPADNTLEKNALLRQLQAFGHDVVQSVLVNNPPDNVYALLNSQHLYVYPDLLVEHFEALGEPNKGRTLMLHRQTESTLGEIGAAHWAQSKIAKEVPTLPANIQEFHTVWNNLEQKLKTQGVPDAGIQAARAELLNVSTTAWSESHEYAAVPSGKNEADSGLYVAARRQTLYVDAPSQAKKPVPTRFQLETIVEASTRLAEGFGQVPSQFREVTLEQERSAQASYNQLPKPAFKTAETNMLHQDGFVEKSKARFVTIEKNLLPCPAHCVVKSNGEATYHANEVKMPLSKFIAAQGPTAQSADLFWQMVDAQNSEVVVDLTNPNDPSLAKRSHAYTPLPGKTTVYPNGTRVTNHGEAMVMNGLFTVQQLEVNGKPRVRIQHNQFDDRTSGAPADLAALSVLVRTISPNLALPVTVHCTAGVGRTSTFISVADQTDHLANGASHDVTEAATTLRNARGSKAIQTSGQWFTTNLVHDHAGEIIGPFLAAGSGLNTGG